MVNTLFNVWLFAQSLQARDRPLGTTGELCPTVSQSERALDRLHEHKPCNSISIIRRFYYMRCFVMLVNAVCLLSLLFFNRDFANS